MAGGKETTRQKMINIMYLVLLAMLALNVSDSILDAFRTITNSLEVSTTNVTNSVDQMFSSFEATKLKESPERAKPLYDKAKQARTLAAELETYVASLKKELETRGGGYDPETGDLVERGNLDIAQGLMINEKKAEELQQRINTTHDKLLALLDQSNNKNVSFTLMAKDSEKSLNGKKKWVDINFGEGTPLTAAMAILTKVQADLKNAESDVVKRILGKMDQAVVNLDQFAAVAVAPSSYLIQGQPYTAEVFLTAYDSKSSPSISVGGQSLSVKQGKGTYTVNTTREGVFTWVGSVSVKQTDGSIKQYRTPEQKYQVSRPSAVVSPDKMNVFYIGVTNPVSLSAPGIPSDKLRVTMSGGSISGANGKYNVKVSSVGTVKINISAEVAPGKTANVGTSEFRVKRIPDPTAKFSGKNGGSVATVALKAQDKIFAQLENFDFDAKFTITRFSLIIAKPRADPMLLSASGNSLNGAMKAAMATITPGTRVIFDNIIATGPDGVPRQLNPVVITAN
ncbi:gliding motility protein GldM [Pedobacter sp. MC2016-14]|uniref:type IX secretion system motor protein PorM/GldM n=1 Tax=Pedobacter sp. MC2016-14 TaxID=2897327 RepID=UPI001E2DEDC9|nr:gliding motility protein GldM [Pedobacter sp. MC2016-14]MCD0486880.1 gliding motility protein GldM [Pedobacter sp. MC2016-14]